MGKVGSVSSFNKATGFEHADPFQSDLRPIKDKAKRLYERITTEGYVKNERGLVAASALVEEIRSVRLEYWVSVDLENPMM